MMTCPHCGKPINAAVALGRMAAGKPKRYSAEEIRKRTKRLAEAREKAAKMRRENGKD